MIFHTADRGRGEGKGYVHPTKAQMVLRCVRKHKASGQGERTRPHQTPARKMRSVFCLGAPKMRARDPSRILNTRKTDGRGAPRTMALPQGKIRTNSVYSFIYSASHTHCNVISHASVGR